MLNILAKFRRSPSN